MQHTVLQLQEFFFEAMRSGWATDAPKQPVLGLPGTKSILFERGTLKLLDYYFVAPKSNHSYGTTVIWESGTPRWIMHYGGFYEKRAIPVLKAALQETYSRNEFIGGRGPQIFRDKGCSLFYRNEPNTLSWRFAIFRGFEGIFDEAENNKKIGEHKYFGGILFRS